MSDNGKGNAQAHYDDIKELYERTQSENGYDEDDIYQEAWESALSVEVSSGWCTLEQYEEEGPYHYRIILTCGGPHLELRGDLDKYKIPCSAGLFFQWYSEEYELWEGVEEDVLLWFASMFYYGE